jgi:large subunit ribosomal protein L20
MPRVKRGTIKNKKRKSLLSKAKGYRFGRSTKKRQAYEAVTHAGVHAFNHRRRKKSDFRRLWQIKISARLKEHGISYSKFINLLNKKEIALDRKILADLAENNPESFSAVVKEVRE